MARRRLTAALLASAALLAAPACAHAGVITLGSDLKADANVTEDHGADSVFWNESLENGGVTAAPVGGQVTIVRVKGSVLPDPTGRKNPVPLILFKTLHRLPDGRMHVEISSAPFYTPIGGDPNAVSAYRPVNMCLHKGDYLSFSDIGGNEWWWGEYSGTPFRVFHTARGSTMGFYTKNAGIMNGSRWMPDPLHQGEELLMQARLETGPDATDFCPGGYEEHVYKGVDLRGGQTATLRTKIREAKVRITCPYESYGSCKGVARAEAIIDGERVLLGGDAFSTRRGYSDSLNIPVPKGVMRRIQRAGSVSVRLTADSHDDPANDPRVYNHRALARDASDRVPVQRRTNTARIKLRADKPR